MQKLRDTFAAVAIWVGSLGILVSLALGLNWLGGEERLSPPGWDCSQLDEVQHTGKCYPAEGWHFEEHPSLGRIAVRDLTATQAERDADIDTANGWRGLTNDQRSEILAGRATIYDYLEFSSKRSQ